MGLFEALEQAAGMGGEAQGQAAAPEGAVGAVAQMLQSHPGGIGRMLQQFESAGLGGVAQSWLGRGPNQSVPADQVQGALGAAPIAQVASELGVSS